MDRTWAKENQWPESMYLPSDKSKGVYLLEAYHYLHCLVSAFLYYLTCFNAEKQKLTMHHLAYCPPDFLGSGRTEAVHAQTGRTYESLL